MCGPESFICTCLFPFFRDHLLPPLKEAANMIRRAPVQVEAMKQQLERAQRFIDEADRKAAAEGDDFKREEIREMAKQLIEAAFQMEDVLGEYILHEQLQQSRRDPGCVAFNPEEAANFIRPGITRFVLAHKIQRVSSRVDEIKKIYKIDDGFRVESSSEQGQASSSSGGHLDFLVQKHREEALDDVVGFKAPKAELIEWLVKGQEKRSTVIFKVEMRGLGKTTIARRVLDNKEMVEYFDCRVWITVTKIYTVEKLLGDMLLQFDKEKYNSQIPTMDRKSLEDEVRNYLQRKRYVVFLHDLWDTKLWDAVEYVLIDDNKGSKIFITTRNTNVALHFKESSILKVHDLELLDEESSFELVESLVKGHEKRTAISVVGMGGQGKTTLARNVFESEAVVAYFECHAWITVSQTYTVEKLLRDMLEQFHKVKNDSPFSTMDQKSLEDEVRNYLGKKRYVVFLDDVWDKELWDAIEYVLIDNRKGSKIFITTRNKNVALHFKKSCILKLHDLKLLDEKSSFTLFCNKAFASDHGGICPKGLKEVSTEIVTKCGGLPLALVVIGGVLSTKYPYEWIDFSKNLFSELESNSDLDVVTKILTFSYDELPFNLKPCLLYFGMYPKGFAVPSMRLISQWIAEGFINQQEEKTMEKVAEGQLIELVHRSLVQVSSFTIDGKVKSCRVHDEVHQMILRKTKSLNFFNSALSGKSRRLSVATTSKALLGTTESSRIRSLLFFIDEEYPKHLMERISGQCKLLKVLDFENFPLSCENFPEGFLDFLHLKYLSLRHSKLVSLPKCIVKLQNLETLDVRQTKIKSLPIELTKLRKLKHLWGYFECLTGQNYSIKSLKYLQTLCALSMQSFQAGLINELGELKKLRYLRLLLKFKEEGCLLFDSINKMEDLEKLSLIWYSTTPIQDLHLISPSPMLQKLFLKGTLEKMPQWISNLPNLVKLTLDSSDLIGDPLKLLKNLPNLLSLNMNDCYKGESLHFSNGAFHNLTELSLHSIESLKSIVIEKGALQSLKEFTLAEIDQLNALPSGIQHLEKLEVLNFHFMPHELVTRITPHGGQDHWMINHVTSLNIYPHYP